MCIALHFATLPRGGWCFCCSFMFVDKQEMGNYPSELVDNYGNRYTRVGSDGGGCLAVVLLIPVLAAFSPILLVIGVGLDDYCGCGLSSFHNVGLFKVDGSSIDESCSFGNGQWQFSDCPSMIAVRAFIVMTAICYCLLALAGYMVCAFILLIFFCFFLFFFVFFCFF